MAALAEERNLTSAKKLSSDVRADICEQFWAEVDEDIKNHIVPIPPEIVYVKLTHLEPH